MANQYKNKVVYNGTTLIDLSDTTAMQSDVASGKYFYLATGEKVEGTASGGGGGSTEELLGTTPYTLLTDANVKLVGSGSYTYGVSAIDAEFADRKNVTLSNTTLTDEGTYWQLADTGASAWYSSTANMYFDGLESGVSYTITVDSLGDGTTCTGGYWVIRDANGDNTYGVINPLAGSSTLTFTATGTSINVFMAAADSAYFDSGIKVARWRNMTITHTESASGTDETLLGELKAGTTITASPTVQVYGITSGGGGGTTIPTLNGKKCVCLGDSATSLMDPPNDYPSVLASNTGMTVINGGFSGCRMSDTHPTAAYKAFGAVPIADAIATGSWTTQDANISVFGSGANEANNLTALKAVDWSTVDYLTIFYGGNDAGNYVLPNNPSNPTDTTTYVGAARYVYNRIHTAYPNIKIIFFVPMYRYWLSDSKDSYQMTFTVSGNTYHYYDWGDALIASPPASGVPVIDMHRTLGIDSTNRQTYLLTSDQTHPSIAGCALIANKVEDEIRLAFLGGAGGSDSGGDEPTYETYFDDSISVGENGIYIASLADLYFADGETWRVTWDGVEYICQPAVYEGWLWTLGNQSLAGADNGVDEPFVLYNYGGGAMNGNARTAGTHTLKLEKQTSSGGGGGGSSTNPLSGKILSTTGDSIAAGAGNNGTGYPEIVASDNNMTLQNVAVGGGTVAYVNANTFCISRSISSMRSDADFVLLEGGGNDADSGVPLGTLSSGYTATLDDTTFAGAIESMFKAALARFPDKKIGYVFIHKCATLFDSRVSNSYYDMAKSACEKWGISYLDLNTQVPPLNYIADLRTTYTANADGYHPNELGYRTFYVPKITAFLNTMLIDNSLINKIVTENGTYLASDDDTDGYSSVTVNVSGGGSSGQIVTGTVTGDGTSILEIPCNFEPDLIYVYGDMSSDVANRGITSLTIIKDTSIYVGADTSTSSIQEYTTSIHGITGYNESDVSSVHATYSNGTLTINTISSSSFGKWRSGQIYNYELSTIGTGGSPTLVTKEITVNGTYTASNDSADGYSSVTVNVPSSGITPTGSINITTNGTHDVTNYASAIVSVSGGGGSSATKHTIHFDFTDETDTDIDVYYNDAFLGTMITAYTPVTYGQKTVTLAQLDGVTWYEPTNIPINTQLVDYNEVRTGYTIDPNGSIVSSDELNCVTDYLPINGTMTFSFSCDQWAYIGFYDNNKNAIRVIVADEIKTSAVDYVASGTLDPSIIPSNAMYVVLRGNSYSIENLSLIRTV